jgi:hypothetical protein
VDARLEAQQGDAVRSGVLGKVIDEPLAVFAAAKLRPDIHALQFAIVAAKELDPAATRRHTVNPQHEERHAFLDQSIHAEPVPALRRVERLQMGLQLVDEQQGVGGVGTFSGDGGRHGVVLP